MNTQSLENLTLLSLKKQIDETKINIKDLEYILTRDLYDKLMDLLVKDSINHFNKYIYNFLQAELLVNTSKEVVIDEDMVLGEYVRNVYITPKFNYLEHDNYDEEYNTLEYKEYIDDDWKYIFPFAQIKDLID
jgi:hypothetical protein